MMRAVGACDRVRVREAVASHGGHPVPNAASREGARDALRVASEARRRDELLLLLLSGGASAMLEVPAHGISLEDLVALNAELLASGLPIAEMNAVRKHVSGIKGGLLAAAAASTLTLAISDVHAPVPDDPATIGSGPTVADPSTFADAERALRSAGLLDRVPKRVKDRLARGVRGEIPETPKPDDPRLTRARFILAGSRQDAMDGAGTEAARRGYRVVRIAEPTVGDATVAARRFVSAAAAAAHGPAGAVCVVASGETTVTLGHDASGKGGRNQEFALASASALPGLGPCVLASIGTDGVDGPTDAAGAIVDSTTLARTDAQGLDAGHALAAHDAYPVLKTLGDLVVTGPTGTNVGDLQLLLTP